MTRRKKAGSGLATPHSPDVAIRSTGRFSFRSSSAARGVWLPAMPIHSPASRRAESAGRTSA